MADLELGVSAVGVDEAVAELAKVDRAQEEIAKSAKAASNEVGGGAKNTAKSLRDTGAAAQSAGVSVGKMGERVGGAASAVGSLASALGGGVGGRAAGLVAAIGGTVAQAAALGATLGPGGVVVGALLGAIPLVAQLAGEQRDAAEAAREHAEALRSQASQMLAMRRDQSVQRGIREGVIGEDTSSEQLAIEAERRRQEIVRLEARAAELAGGPSGRMFASVSATRIRQLRGEIDLLDDEIARREQILSLTRDQHDEAARTSAAQAEQAAEQERLQADFQSQLRDTIAYNEAQEQRAEEARRLREARLRDPALRAIREAVDAALPDQAARDRDAARLGEVTIEERLGGIGDGGSDLDSFIAGAARDGADAMRDAIDAANGLADAQADLKAAATDAYTAFATGWTDSIDQVVEAWREANTAAAAAGQGMISRGRLMERSLVAVGNNIAETIGGTMKSAFESSLSAWMDGSKSFVEAAEDMVHGVIKALTIESIVQAVTEIARGLAALAGGQYDKAPMHFAAAAAWGAVAGVAGAVGAGIGSFGGGGQQGGGGGTDARSLAAGAVEERERAPENITINVYPGQVFATEDAVDNAVFDAVDRATRRSGRRLDRRAIPRT